MPKLLIKPKIIKKPNHRLGPIVLRFLMGVIMQDSICYGDQKIRMRDEYPGFVYIIVMESNQFFKFGFSTNPQNRLYHLQNANPEVLSLKFFYPAPRCLETQVHSFFKEYRIRGSEWYPIEIYDDLVEFLLDNLTILLKFSVKKQNRFSLPQLSHH